MNITRKSQLTGEPHTMDLPVTYEQLYHFTQHHMDIVNAFPDLTSLERSFVAYGTTEKEWVTFVNNC